MKKEIHLQISGCSWNAIPVMSYVACNTIVEVDNSFKTYPASTVTQMTAIYKINGHNNKAIGRGKFSGKRYTSMYALIQH